MVGEIFQLGNLVITAIELKHIREVGEVKASGYLVLAAIQGIEAVGTRAQVQACQLVGVAPEQAHFSATEVYLTQLISVAQEVIKLGTLTDIQATQLVIRTIKVIERWPVADIQATQLVLRTIKVIE
jgi:hypothetical protein